MFAHRCQFRRARGNRGQAAAQAPGTCCCWSGRRSVCSLSAPIQQLLQAGAVARHCLDNLRPADLPKGLPGAQFLRRDGLQWIDPEQKEHAYRSNVLRNLGQTLHEL